MKKVVSIALFGDGDKYARYLGAFVRAHLNLFPIEEGWSLRVHTDRPTKLIYKLNDAQLIEMRVMESAALTKAMLWRVAPVFDRDVDFVFCRDLDAAPLPRDRAACEEFMRSGCVIHTIHDNVQHVGIMGGLCGFHAPAFRDATGLKSLAEFYIIAERALGPAGAPWGTHGVDQVALNQMFLRPSAPRFFEHRYAGWKNGEATNENHRVPGRYACAGISAPVPSKGVSKLTGELAEKAERIANHMGAPGYDHEAAIRFYDSIDEKIAAQVAACER